MRGKAASTWILAGLRFLARVSLACVVFLAICDKASAQGMAAGGTAVRAKPLPAGLKPPEVNYEDIAAQAGLIGKNVSGSERNPQYILEAIGTGVAIFDFDNDGLPDILIVNGDRLQKEGESPKHFLYHNLGGLKFEDVTEKAGLTHTGWGQGVCAGDIDNDGFTDIFITQWGQNNLFRNQGDGTFRDETKERGLLSDGSRWSSGCAFFDFNRDGHLDLVVAHYVTLDIANTPRPGDKAVCMWKGKPVVCGPRGLPGETISLYENDGKGHFTDVSAKMHIIVPRDNYCFTPLIGDFDNDGWPDIYVACDSSPSLYYRNLGGKSFEERGAVAGVAFNEDGREQAGMGVVAADFSSSGMLDIFKTNFTDDTSTFYRNHGKNNFEDATVAAGLATNTRFLGWGAAALDIDNDGWKDLIVANGHVYPGVEDARAGESYKQSRLIYWNGRNGQFYDRSASSGSGITAAHSSRGLAAGDLNNDGNEEIVMVNMNEAPTLLKNVAPRIGKSVLIRAINRFGSDAIGARVTVTAGGHKQVDEVRSGGSFMSQNDFRLHFGVGMAASVSIAVRWPDGTMESFPAVDANQFLTVQEAKGIVHKQAYTQAGSLGDRAK